MSETEFNSSNYTKLTICFLFLFIFFSFSETIFPLPPMLFLTRGGREARNEAPCAQDRTPTGAKEKRRRKQDSSRPLSTFTNPPNPFLQTTRPRTCRFSHSSSKKTAAQPHRRYASAPPYWGSGKPASYQKKTFPLQ